MSYGKTGVPNGNFLEMPELTKMLEKDFTIKFYVNKGTFKGTPEIVSANNDEQKVSEALVEIAKNTMKCINIRYPKEYSAIKTEKSKDFTVHVGRIDTIEKATNFVNFIGFVMTLYLIQS